MDTSLLISVVIAIVAIIPGVWTLISQANKDSMSKEERIEKAYDIGYTAMSFIEGMKSSVSKLQMQSHALEDRLIGMDKEEYVNELWKRLYEKPVIVRCKHCDSPNVITNITCTQCGAPLK